MYLFFRTVFTELLDRLSPERMRALGSIAGSQSSAGLPEKNLPARRRCHRPRHHQGQGL
jgi:hypothetical protein